MDTDVNDFLTQLKEKTRQARENKALIEQQENIIKEEKRIKNLKAEVKSFFIKEVTEDKLILFAEEGENRYPIFFVKKEASEGYFWEKKDICEFGRFLWEEIEVNGFKPAIIKIQEKNRAKYFSNLHKDKIFTTGYYLSIIW